MRIIYRDVKGRRVVREFSDWGEMCVWLKRFYPFLKMVEEVGDLLRSDSDSLAGRIASLL